MKRKTSKPGGGIDRRHFMQITGGLGAVAASGVSMPFMATRANAATKVNVPAFIPFQGPTPDLPGDAAGVPEGFTTFPKKLVKSVTKPPVASGKPINAFVQTITAPPTAMGQNAVWQAVNKSLGAEINLNIVPQAQVKEKFSTLMASGDYPEMAFVPTRTGSNFPPSAAQYIQAACADLTPHLGGNAIKDFPNLANIATGTWRAGVYFNGVRGVPISRSFVGEVLYVRQDFVDKYQIAWPKNADEFKRFCKELTRPQEGVWAMGASPNAYDFLYFNQVFGGPNNWRLSADGKLTKDIESEECRAAVAYVRELVAAGYFYPDQMPSQEAADTNLLAGKFALRRAAWSNYVNLWNRANGSGSGAKVRVVPIFKHDGGKPTHHLYSGSFGCTVIKKASEDRVRELLGVLNLLSAPFGTEEHLAINFGVEGQTFTYDEKGNPRLNDKGRADVAVPFHYLGTPRYALFNPADPEHVTVGHQFAKSAIPFGVEDPTALHFSPTDGTKTGLLTALIYDHVVKMVTSRAPMSNYDTMLNEWRAQGGDQIRKEYLDSLNA